MSISSTIGQYAASNPVGGQAVSSANTSATLLGGLSSSGSGPFDTVLGAAASAPLQIANSSQGSGVSALPASSSPFAAVLTASSPSAAATLDNVSNQGAIDSQLLAATGLGQNVNTFA